VVVVEQCQMLLRRRGLLTALLALPAIIRTPGLLMPIKPVLIQSTGQDWWPTSTIGEIERRNREFYGLYELGPDAAENALTYYSRHTVVSYA